MNSRERLLAALDLKMADRVPVSTYSLGAGTGHSFEYSDPSYARLVRVIREKTDRLFEWSPSSNHRFLHSAHPVEIDETTRREDDATVTERTVRTPKGDLHQVVKVVDDIHTVWQTEHLCKTIEDVEKALSVPYEPVAYDGTGLHETEAELGDGGILVDDASDALCSVAPLMEFGDYTVWAMTEREHFQKTLDRVHERIMENLRRQLDVCVLPLYRSCGSEYATPPYLPPELFERYVVPYAKDIVELIHSRGAKVRIHCHGKMGRVLDMIAATGVDGIDPCEPPPDGDVELAEVKKRVGDRLCLFGNIELKLLERGTPDDVEAEVKRSMDAAKPGGGYVLLPTSIPYGSPLSEKTEENYLRYIDAALKYGKY